MTSSNQENTEIGVDGHRLIETEPCFESVLQGVAKACGGATFPTPPIPPWHYDDAIPQGAFAWQLGRAGEYLDHFKAWFKAQPADRRAEFVAEYPEPVSWSGFYQGLSTT